MPANSRWDLIQRYRVKIVKNPGNGRLNNLNDPVLNVLRMFKDVTCFNPVKHIASSMYHLVKKKIHFAQSWKFHVFWDVTLCRRENGLRRFERWHSAFIFSVKLCKTWKALGYSETPGTV